MYAAPYPYPRLCPACCVRSPDLQDSLSHSPCRHFRLPLSPLRGPHHLLPTQCPPLPKFTPSHSFPRALAGDRLFLHEADLTPPCKDHPPPQNREAHQAQDREEISRPQNHICFRVQAFPSSPGSHPGAMGGGPGSRQPWGANGTWDSVYQVSGFLMQKPAPRPLPSGHPISPEPGRGGHRQESLRLEFTKQG